MLTITPDAEVHNKNIALKEYIDHDLLCKVDPNDSNKHLLDDLRGSLRINGRHLKDLHAENALILTGLTNDSQTQADANEFLGKELGENYQLAWKYYTQDPNDLGLQLLNGPLYEVSMNIAAQSNALNLYQQEGEVFLSSEATDFKIDNMNGRESCFMLPGSIKTIFKLTENGFVLNTIEVSNEFLEKIIAGEVTDNLDDYLAYAVTSQQRPNNASNIWEAASNQTVEALVRDLVADLKDTLLTAADKISAYNALYNILAKPAEVTNSKLTAPKPTASPTLEKLTHLKNTVEFVKAQRRFEKALDNEDINQDLRDSAEPIYSEVTQMYYNRQAPIKDLTSVLNKTVDVLEDPTSEETINKYVESAKDAGLTIKNSKRLSDKMLNFASKALIYANKKANNKFANSRCILWATKRILGHNVSALVATCTPSKTA